MMWLEGDEVYYQAEYGDSTDRDDVPKSAETRFSALAEHVWTRHPLSARVQSDSVDAATRCAAITWLAFASPTTKRLDTRRGFRDWEKWRLYSLIDWWWHILPISVKQDLIEHTEVPHLFTITMENAGHTCHLNFDFLAPWLYMRSFLYPELPAVCLENFADFHNWDKGRCRACLQSGFVSHGKYKVHIILTILYQTGRAQRRRGSARRC
jgi:hypothetical protein